MTSGSPAAEHHVTVEGVRLRFAAAHMATLGDELEPLHGHNYEVQCRVDGALTSDQWVIDFSELKRVVRETCQRLDHRFLLQRESKLIEISEESDCWILSFGGRRYEFPAADVAALPIENTTAELIAKWIWEQVAQSLARAPHDNLVRLSVDVEEMPGQTGGYSRALATR